MNFKHYLITRFNVPFKDYLNDKNGGIVRSNEWLQHRFDLFERFCFPSVKAQTNQNFTWLVFFDEATPPNFKEQIHEIGKNCSNFNPIYVDSAEAFKLKLNQYIQNHSGQTETLITSRIDNDDAIHQDYIKTIQQIKRKQTDALYNFKWGVQLDLKTGILYQSKDESNPFISRICKYNSQNIKTVFDFGHHEAEKYLPIHQITTLKGWLVIIHDKNMINSIGGKPLITKDKILKSYNILDFGKKHSMINYTIAKIKFYYKAIIAKLF
jgi:hypothetical protein